MALFFEKIFKKGLQLRRKYGKVVKSGTKWSGKMLIGEYHHNIDVKGRVIIPAKFRESLGDSFVVSKGSNNCINIYSANEWEMFRAELLALRTPDASKLRRFFFSSAAPVDLDAQGRILIPPAFREYAELTKDLAIVGVSNHAEIWDKQRWDEYMSDPIFTSEEITRAIENLGF